MEILSKVWYWVRWPLAVLLGFYILIVLYRIPAVGEQDRTAKAVEKIHSQKITFSDVMGDVLPPTPNKEENDATIEGIDKNNNGVRDDVELAIFAKYPNSAKIRAAELQYAMAEQILMTQVFNTETWKAGAFVFSRADGCLADGKMKSELEKLLLNTSSRKEAEDAAFKYTTSLSLPNSNLCDVDISLLSN